MRLGIPKALFYFRYGDFWQEFFKYLDIDIIISPKTNKQILDMGLKKVSSEICLPVKIIAGHIEWLKDKVDAIFLPRFVELNHGLYTCPKMVGVVDIARMQVGDKCQILSPKIKNNFMFSHFRFGLKLSNNPMRVKNALHHALPYLNNHTNSPNREVRLPQNPKCLEVEPPIKPTILLLSHFYNLGDDFIGQDIKSTFSDNGFTLCTKEDLDVNVLSSQQGFAKNIRWVYERELYNAYQYNLDKVDGICDIISFGCGPDSLIGEIMMKHANENKVPFLQLVIDEHTSKTGLITRIEAFSEIIKRKAKVAELHGCQN